MNKKLGLILLFVGAYATLLGGLFWNLHFDGIGQVGVDYQIYDWSRGLVCAIVIVIGAVIACKKFITCFVGCGITFAGMCGAIAVLTYGLKHNYAPILLIIGIAATLIGTILTFVIELRDYLEILKSNRE